MDRLTLIAELIELQFQEKVGTTQKNCLTAAHLNGFPEELAKCVDSDKSEKIFPDKKMMNCLYTFPTKSYILKIYNVRDCKLCPTFSVAGNSIVGEQEVNAICVLLFWERHTR